MICQNSNSPKQINKQRNLSVLAVLNSRVYDTDVIKLKEYQSI